MDKLWRDAVRKKAAEYAEGKAGPKKLDKVAEALFAAAMAGDVSAAKEIGDRMDGKVPQALTGEGGTGPVALAITWLQPSK